MKLKYYLRGMGIGVILTAIIMGFALGGRKATISDAEVIERAKQLGMVENGVLTDSQNVNEEYANESNTSASAASVDEAGKEISQEIDEIVSSTGESISELAKEEEEGNAENKQDKQTEESASSSTTAQSESSASTGKTNSLTNETASSEASVSETSVSAASTTSTTTTAATTTTATTTTNDTNGSVTVTIPKGQSSDSVAVVLYNAGVIDNASSFNRYLIDKGLDRIIRSGNKVIPSGATYEEIAYIITH